MIHIKKTHTVTVLTGAGISAESGVRTFHDNNGLWEDYRVEDVATPEAFERDPKLVWQFYNERRKQAKTVVPNPAHTACVRLEEYLKGRFTLITQNVDPLHQVAGSKNILPMHGELFKIRCTRCGKVEENDRDLPALPHCSCSGLLRPHIVWFGEMPQYMEKIQTAVSGCDFFITIGTSGMVYPAAGLLAVAKQAGVVTIGVNLDKPENVSLIDHFFQGKAGELLPELIDQWIDHQ